MEFFAELLRASAVFLPGWDTLFQVFTLGIIAALIITPMEALAPACKQRLILRKGLGLDVLYWFATPLLTRTITGIVLGVFLFLVTIVTNGALSEEQLRSGFGPVSRQAVWLQALEILLISDFMDYWSHRSLHLSRFWRIHAIHHSPQEMSWLSSARVHPLNDLITRSFQLLPIMLLGFAAETVLVVVPFVSFYVMFLHSNVRWDFGPLRWVFVSPAYHRWHHTSDTEGLDKNFAGIFPVWDVLFKTAYFPRRLPERYGLKGKQLRESFVEHFLFPFRSLRKL